MNHKMRLIIILIIAMIITGCSGSVEVIDQRESQAKKDGKIVIGVAWPFETRGDLFEEGLEMALEEVNAAGGILGHELVLVKQDDGNSVTDALSVAQFFSNYIEMVAVIGHRSSATTLPASAIYENAGLLMISPASTAPKLTLQDYEYIFRSIPSDTQIGAQMAQHASAKGYKNVAIFYTDDEYGRGLANSFEDRANEAGINIIDRLSSYSDMNDLKRITDIWKTLDIDAVFLVDVMPHGAEFITKLRQVGLDVPILGGDGLDSDDLINIGGGAVEGTVVASIFHLNSDEQHIIDFIESFTNKYSVAPNKFAAQGYDAVYMLADAIQLAGSKLPADISRTLKEMDAWSGVTGSHSFGHDGDIIGKPIVIKTVQRGMFEYLD